ncbi:MAG: mechanosensitive ion channel family protein [Bacillota bacterium]
MNFGDVLREFAAELFRLERLIFWGGSLLKIILITLIARMAVTVGFSLIDKFLRPRRDFEDNRLRTLATLCKSVLRYIIYFAALLQVLVVLGVDTTSFLAGAGILGLAVGFGAQSLVKDVITGFFLLFEDQFSIGEYVEMAQVAGTVEEMGLRSTKIRDLSGVLHTIPNGSITTTSNWSRGNMRALVEVSVAYEEDVEQVLEILEKVCREMAREMDTIKEGPSVLGVSKLGGSEVSILVWAKTTPMNQWSVEREIRKRVKQAFDEAGVEIPYPRRVLVPPEETKIGKRRKRGTGDHGEHTAVQGR